MYLASVVLLLLVLPAVSTAIELLLEGGALIPILVKWFVFWPVGARLFLAGVRQVFDPRFTAETIFAVKDPAALPIVREVGFGNLAIGTLGLLSLPLPSVTLPAAIVGAIYYGLAGAGHLVRGERNAHETIALVSDLMVSLVMAGIVLDLL